MTPSPHSSLPLLAARGLTFSRNDEPVFGPLDFVVAAGLQEKAGHTERYFGFDGKNGHELFRTKDLKSDIMTAESALAHGRLLIAKRNGNTAQAQRSFKRTVELQPDHIDAQRELRLLQKK